MPWKECSTVSQREEFVQLALSSSANIALLCRRFGVSRKTGYRWLGRYRQEGRAGLFDRSRRPVNSPGRTSSAVEQEVVELRRSHPAWGGRKISARLRALDLAEVPAPSTVTSILHRHGLIEASASLAARCCQRFEHSRPNDMWQMDFKGDFALCGGHRCHPLTVLDDHSRYNVVLRACPDQQGELVGGHLQDAFRLYGLPRTMLMDHGSPWGPSSSTDYWTSLAVWLVRLGIRVIHGRIRHPQTQGKEERFHRTLKAEVLRWRMFDDLAAVQQAFDAWRRIYNYERPHEALGLGVPSGRYQPSSRSYPEQLPPIEYESGTIVRMVKSDASIGFRGRRYRIGKAFRNQPVALRATAVDGQYVVYYCDQRIGVLDARAETYLRRPVGKSLAPLTTHQPAP